MPVICMRKQEERGRERERGGDVLLTASHSLISSPGGSLTASLKFPLPNVESMCCLSCAPCNKENDDQSMKDDPFRTKNTTLFSP